MSDPLGESDAAATGPGSDTDEEPADEDDVAAAEAEAEVDALRGRMAVLEEENERLREEYAHSRRARYRRTGASLAAIGGLTAVAGFLYPGARTILLALGGTGVFLGVLVYYLTPETFIPATVGERVYRSYADTGTAMVGELGLTDRRVYVPEIPGENTVRLYVPRSTAADLPERDALTDVFVVTDDHRGLSLRPTGAGLFDELERATSGDLGDDPARLAEHLTDALLEQFELAESAEADVDPAADPDAGRFTVAVADSVYGDVDAFDHPIASLLGAGAARALDAPVDVSVSIPEDDRADFFVTCVWGDEDAESERDPDSIE